MRRILLSLILLVFPFSVASQGGDDDRGYIQALLEDALSAEGRDVRLEGFAGALSSRATIDRITVSDADGPWLTASGVVLIWSRSALLSGHVSIREITIEDLDLARLPLPAADDVPSPEAGGAFALPELPVSVDIAEMRIEKAALGAALLGQPVEIAFAGSANLAGGAGKADLAVRRLDKPGDFSIKGAFDNTTRQLGLNLNLHEPAGGIVVDLLNIPNRPSIALTVRGEDPISDFEAQVKLETDGKERLRGLVTLLTDADGTARFAADLGGDIAPVFIPEFSGFLGENVQFTAQGARSPDGALSLDALRLEAAALKVSGAARIGADGWPRSLALDAAITPPEGETVILPLPGAQTTVRDTGLTFQFDADAGDIWRVDGRARDFSQPGMAIKTLGFSGEGKITRQARMVQGALALDADGITPDDAGLARAIGDTLAGKLRFGWTGGAPVRLREIDLSGDDFGLTGTMTIGRSGDAGPITLVPDIRLAARDLARFADIAGTALSGGANLAIAGSVAPLTGGFALEFNGTTKDLAIGVAQADPLLRGDGKLHLKLTRDETGMKAAPLRIETPQARIEGRAALATSQSDLELTARVKDLSQSLPGLIGPARITAKAVQNGAEWSIDANAQLPGQSTASYRGTITGDGKDALAIEGRMRAAIGHLGSYAQLAGRALSGSARITLEGRGDPLAKTFDLTATGDLEDPAFGIPQAEALLRGTTNFDIAARRDAQGNVSIRRGLVDGPGIGAQLSGSFGPDSGTLRYHADVANLGLALPVLPGAARLEGTAARTGNVWALDTRATLPGGTGASYDGTITSEGASGLRAEGKLSAEIVRLSAFSSIAGRPLSGALSLAAQGSADLSQAMFDIAAQGTITNPSFAVPAIEPLLRGTSQFQIDARRDGSGQVTLRDITLDGPRLDAEISGDFGPDTGQVNFRLAAPDIGVLVPELPGPALVSGTATRQGDAFRLDATGKGPGGIDVTARGRVAADGSRLDIATSGKVPLALANRQLRGQALSGFMQFDLAVNGPPALASVSGRLGLSGARLALPDRGLALDGITGGADLAAGRARIAVAADLSTGGQIRISGPVTLSAPFEADLVADLRNLVLRDASLYEAQLGGRITAVGPLTGGARIGGTIDIATAELRVPSFGPSYSALDGLRHVSPPPNVRRTLQFAGMEEVEETARPLPDYPLDLVVRAPNRLFVRGRGLDAELGGTLRLKGSSNDIVPVGGFSLIRGRLDLLGRRLELTQGEVQLRGSFDPVLAFEAISTVNDVIIALQIEGVASEPELTVTSTPELPQDEALSLFLFGRDLTSISALQAVQLAAAVRTLSGRGGLGLTGSLRKGLGVDTLDIGTDAEGNAEASVGTYISDEIYTEVTVNGAGESEVNLNFDLSPTITLRGKAGSDGDTGIGIFYERDY